MKSKVAFKTIEGKNEILNFYNSILEKWYLPYENAYLNTSYGKTFVIAYGEKDAPPLILLHGSAMNSMMWLNDIKEYSRYYRVYAVDIPGEPGKSDEHQLSLSSSDNVEWLKEVLNELSIEKTNIIGISLGAWIGLKFAVAYPEKVNKLVLISPAGIGPQKISFLFKAAFYGIFGEKGFEKLYYKVNGNKKMPEIILSFQRLVSKHFNFRREMVPLVSDSEIKSMHFVPTAIFIGKRDIIIDSSKTVKRIKTLMPNAHLNFMNEEGHALVNLVDKIIDFLRLNTD